MVQRMVLSETVTGTVCTACGRTGTVESTDGRCPDCGGILDITYDLAAIDPDAIMASGGGSLWQFEQLLPVADTAAVTMGEGTTPLVSCSSIADELGVADCLIKDDGQLPTGTTHDRRFAVTMSALASTPVTDIALPSTGAAGQSAAAYAARANIAAHVFQPSRADFVSQAMTNVHDADLNVVEGRYAETVETFEAAREQTGWHSVAPFATPFGHEGLKTMAIEIVADLDWTAPDVILLPEGHGLLAHAIAKGLQELATVGIIDSTSQLVLVQPEGCAPIATALQDGTSTPTPVSTPDTICPDLEIPAPAGGELAVQAVTDSGGQGVTVADKPTLGAACWVAATTGVELRASGATTVRAALELAEDGYFDTTDTVVIINPGAGVRDADIIRSHLMSTEWDRMPTPSVE